GHAWPGAPSPHRLLGSASPRAAGKCAAWAYARQRSACPISAKERDMQRFMLILGVALMALLLASHNAPLKAEDRVVHFFQVNALTGQAGSYATSSIHALHL